MIVEIDGREYDLPDDATDDEIIAFANRISSPVTTKPASAAELNSRLKEPALNARNWMQANLPTSWGQVRDLGQGAVLGVAHSVAGAAAGAADIYSNLVGEPQMAQTTETLREAVKPKEQSVEAMKEIADTGIYLATGAGMQLPQYALKGGHILKRLAELGGKTAIAGARGGLVEGTVAEIVGDDPEAAAILGAIFPAAAQLSQPIREAVYRTGATWINKTYRPSGDQLTHRKNVFGYESTWHGRNPGKTIIDEGISGASVERVLNQINDRIERHGKTLDRMLSKSSGKRDIDVLPAMSDALDVLRKESEEVSGDAVRVVEDVYNALITNISRRGGLRLNPNGGLESALSPSEVVALKRDMDKYLGDRFFAKVAEGGDAGAAQKLRYMYAVRSSLDRLVDAAVPATKGLNQRLSDLYVARDVTAIADKGFQSQFAPFLKHNFIEAAYQNTPVSTGVGRLGRWLASLQGYPTGALAASQSESVGNAYGRISER